MGQWRPDSGYIVLFLNRVFVTYFMYWIAAAYPVENAIHPMNNWGQDKARGPL